jgi:hypothetical protein
LFLVDNWLASNALTGDTKAECSAGGELLSNNQSFSPWIFPLIIEDLGMSFVFYLTQVFL